jgi:hypothetical protein
MRATAVWLTLCATAIAPLAAQDKSCEETRYPPQLPAPSALVDSAHAIADLVSFASSKPMVFSLVFNKGDSVPHVRALDKSDVAAAQVLVNYIRHQTAAEMWAIRIHVAGGATPALTLERSHYCPPRPLSGDGRIHAATVQTGGRTLFRTGPDASLGRGRDVLYEALVATDGHVLFARILNPSNTSEADADVQQTIQRQRFRPALLDDEPVVALFRPGGGSPRP